MTYDQRQALDNIRDAYEVETRKWRGEEDEEEEDESQSLRTSGQLSQRRSVRMILGKISVTELFVFTANILFIPVMLAVVWFFLSMIPTIKW